ncbi:hypothetical protein APS56_09395 [Pseudalgibacter alginicilyticus]|uniref:Uncharacterized protein n=1 Tax=Pseudalgibacter alginicilyticus TaxID=1736674 RepID=A0A0P0CLL0_9FLAO|nr:hypothetical protein [Pseudalgibacter alginicilyticus]ALJ05325.1 hypothetical protein APS56_09395 [Pseudalgibacter alginicilyticus]
MKITSITLIVIAIIFIGINATEINFDTPFKGDSMIAIITIVASLCVILMMLILRTSKRIEQKFKNKN